MIHKELTAKFQRRAIDLALRWSLGIEGPFELKKFSSRPA